jgi:hypothetical protein
LTRNGLRRAVGVASSCSSGVGRRPRKKKTTASTPNGSATVQLCIVSPIETAIAKKAMATPR